MCSSDDVSANIRKRRRARFRREGRRMNNRKRAARAAGSGVSIVTLERIGRVAGVTAVFAANDQMALGLLRAFTERGIRVPVDVSVVGFDDIPEAAYLSPRLTTVRQDFDEVGRRSMGLLQQLIESAEPAEEAPPVVPTLAIRDSTAPPR
ncbi:substrate-binding domain-containing protein [Nocardia sp. KC 131]|uniref:substrate-binding domain-containing protein n=1 Tax=Nocardia arseniciresistens TaxID=3392119 RepID=UPI00398EF45C